MGALDIAIVGPALKPIGESFGVDERALAWVFTTYVLFNLVGNPLMARLSDIYGRREIYSLDIALFAAGSLVVALAPGFSVLLLGRAVQGLAAGGIFPVASATIGETFPPERRGRALGATGAMFGLAFLVGPLLGGVLLPFGWPWFFLVNLPLATLVLWLGARVLPSSPQPGPVRFDWPGMGLLAAGLACLTLGLNGLDARHPGASLASPRVWALLVTAVVVLSLFWRGQQRTPDPVVHPDLLKNRQLRLVYRLAAISGLVHAVLIFVPALAAAAFGVRPATASLLLVPAVTASAVGAPLAGRLLDRLGSRAVLTAACATLAAGLLLVPLTVRSLPLFAAAGAAIGFGLAGLTGAPLRYAVLSEAAGRTRAASLALLTVFASVGQMAGGALIGAVIASHGGAVSGYSLAFLLVAAAAAAGLLVASGLKGREAERFAARREGPTQSW